jgi:hypothetical protein
MYKKYAKIFSTHTSPDGYEYYNLLKNLKIDLDSKTSYTEMLYSQNMHWIDISHKFYATGDLWWVICVVNNINNPFNYPEPGTKLKIPTPETVQQLLNFLDQ